MELLLEDKLSLLDNKLRLQNASQRAMSNERLHCLKLIIESYLVFDEQTRVLSIAAINKTQPYSKQAMFYRLLEFCAAHLGDTYLSNTNKPLIFRFYLPNEKTIDFHLAKDRRNGNRQQIVIKREGKATPYQNLSFVKNQTKSREVAKLMDEILRAPIHLISEVLADMEDSELLAEILDFLLITHVAETYRNASSGPLQDYDVTQVQLKKYKLEVPENKESILSRTPGTGKLTRAYIQMVLDDKTDFSLGNLQTHLPFIKAGGTSIQRAQALGLESLSLNEELTQQNMSASSALVIASLSQIPNGKAAFSELCFGSNKCDLQVTRKDNLFEVVLINPDFDPESPFTSEELEQLRELLMDTARQQEIELDVAFDESIANYLSAQTSMRPGI